MLSRAEGVKLLLLCVCVRFSKVSNRSSAPLRHMLKIHHQATFVPHLLKLSLSSCCFHVGILFILTAWGIGHVRYINILTRLRGFQVKRLYLVLCLLYLSPFWELRDKRNLKNLQF